MRWRYGLRCDLDFQMCLSLLGRHAALRGKAVRVIYTLGLRDPIGVVPNDVWLFAGKGVPNTLYVPTGSMNSM